jgi:hypothetical protein
MKKLLALALVAIMAGGALAQTPYLYEGCEYRIGVFFSTDAETFEVSSEATNLDFPAGAFFYMHLIVMDSPDMISAYEMQVSGLGALVIASWIPVPNAGFLNLGDDFNHIATFGFPQPNPDGVIKFGHWNIFPLAPEQSLNVAMGPAVPSSIQGDGPVFVVNSELVRANFTVGDYSGCLEDLAPGMFPEFVGTTYGPGVDIEVESVATETRSLSSVKALFQ